MLVKTAPRISHVQLKYLLFVLRDADLFATDQDFFACGVLLFLLGDYRELCLPYVFLKLANLAKFCHHTLV